MSISYALNNAAMADLARLTEHTTRSYRAQPAGEDPNKGWHHEQMWRFTDGEQVKLESQSNSDTLFPATAGYEMLWFEAPQDGNPATYDIAEHVRREPIVGWHLSSDGCNDDVAPITVEGRVGESWYKTFQAVTVPDGSVIWRGPVDEHLWQDGGFIISASFDEWIELVREAWPKQIKREAEEKQRRTEAAKPCSACGRGATELDDEIPF